MMQRSVLLNVWYHCAYGSFEITLWSKYNVTKKQLTRFTRVFFVLITLVLLSLYQPISSGPAITYSHFYTTFLTLRDLSSTHKSFHWQLSASSVSKWLYCLVMLYDYMVVVVWWLLHCVCWLICFYYKWSKQNDKNQGSKHRPTSFVLCYCNAQGLMPMPLCACRLLGLTGWFLSC